jgi:hypothetical protein
MYRSQITAPGFALAASSLELSATFATVVVFLLYCSPANAGLTAADDFNYSPTGFALNGQQGGGSFGFSGPWSGDTSYAILPGNLPSPIIPGPSGNMVSSSAAGGNRDIHRPFAAALGTPGTSTYISFTIRPDGVLNAGFDGGWFGMFLDGGAHKAGFSYGAGLYGLDVIGGPFANTTTQAAVGKSEFVVMRFDWTTGPDPMTVYMNPPAGAVAPAAPSAQLLGQDLGAETSIDLTGPGASSFDTLRIGTTYASVAIPEPSSIALLGLGLVGFVFMIGRKAFRFAAQMR